MASLIHQHGHYYLQFYDATRSPKRKRIPLGVRGKRAAEPVRAKLERDYALGTFDPWTDAPLAYDRVIVKPERLDQAVAAFLFEKRHRAKRTQQGYKAVLERFVCFCGGSKGTSTITSIDVEGWLNTTEANDVSLANYVRHLRVFFRWAKKQGCTTTVATEGMQLRRLPRKFNRFLSSDEVDRIVESARSAGRDWLADAVIVAVHTGLRRSELVNLLFEHVDIHNGTLLVASTEHFTPKSGCERMVPLSRAAAAATLRRREMANGSAFVFNHTRGPLSPSYLSHAFKRAARDAGIGDVRLHHLRHTACSWLAQRGVPVEAIRRFAGHSSISVTEKYMHLSDDVYKQRVESALNSVE